jgi:hypothetical protein
MLRRFGALILSLLTASGYYPATSNAQSISQSCRALLAPNASHALAASNANLPVQLRHPGQLHQQCGIL